MESASCCGAGQMHVLLELVALAALVTVLIATYRAFRELIVARGNGEWSHRFSLWLVLLVGGWSTSAFWFVLLGAAVGNVREVGGWPLLAGPLATVAYWLRSAPHRRHG